MVANVIAARLVVKRLWILQIQFFTALEEKVCVLVARDRTKTTVSKVVCKGRFVKTKVDGTIGSKLTPNNVLVTDAWRAYKRMQVKKE